MPISYLLLHIKMSPSGVSMCTLVKFGHHLTVNSLQIAITQTGDNTTRRYDLTSELDAVIFDGAYES